MAKYRTFTPEFKAQIVLAILSGAKSQAELCREHHLKDSVVIRWKTDFLANAPKLFEASSQRRREVARMAELEQLVGRLTLQLEMAKKVSALLESRRTPNDP